MKLYLFVLLILVALIKSKKGCAPKESYGAVDSNQTTHYFYNRGSVFFLTDFSK